MDIFQIIMAIEKSLNQRFRGKRRKITTVGDAVEQIKKHCKIKYNGNDGCCCSEYLSSATALCLQEE